ncbi:unnamed protein product [Dracunculus medinensis]|uniref:ABC-2 type transporter transmembrane domain-containing protein n=1 Tax=Dracunculus medinensis TaxID=318479 RepID=A0A3P7SEH4_DRAME|nr:unnamed protein product [Dracunculus medinensis]
MIQRILMGFFLGTLYFTTTDKTSTKTGKLNINAALFFLVCEYTYPSVFGILAYLPSEYALFRREYHDGLYGVSAYYLAKVLALLPIFTIDGFHVILALTIGVLIEQSSTAFGFMLSAISPSFTIAISIAGPLLTIFSLTGGLYANIGQLPGYINWLQYISWFR